MSCFRTFKTFALAVLIIVGFTMQSKHAKAGGLETLTVAGGCFWCVEADFEKVQGVKDVVSGFTGGSVENPTYKQVVRGGTGHYEAVQIMFDPSVVNRDSILTLFFRSIDPTDAGGQFCDRGETYRTVTQEITTGDRSFQRRTILVGVRRVGCSARPGPGSVRSRCRS